MQENNESKDGRHGYEKKTENPTSSLTKVSIGKQEKELLKHLFDIRDSRFNVKAYNRATGIARSTIYDMLFCARAALSSQAYILPEKQRGEGRGHRDQARLRRPRQRALRLLPRGQGPQHRRAHLPQQGSRGPFSLPQPSVS